MDESLASDCDHMVMECWGPLADLDFKVFQVIRATCIKVNSRCKGANKATSFSLERGYDVDLMPEGAKADSLRWIAKGLMEGEEGEEGKDENSLNMDVE